MTEKVYEELHNAKSEIENLRSEYHVKSNLCNSMKRSHDEQIKKIQELNLKLEKQDQELEAKTDEIYAANQSLKDLECKLKEKDNIIKSFTSTNEKLRIDFNSKLHEIEEEKRDLLSSLDEANMKIQELEQKNRDFVDKIEVLKEGIVSVSQKKCASESKVAKASKQMRERGDMFEKLEEEKVKLEEEIKWKDEQFKHLEEAHEKVRNNLRIKEKEWDMEKSSFFDEISNLETKLDSQITLSEDLKRRLEICSQDLAHEQTLRRSQIQEASNSSTVAKLQKKLKNLEQIHSKCSSQSDVKEAEWGSQMDKMVSDLNSCKQEIEHKDICLKKITKELSSSSSSVEMLQKKIENLEQIHSKCSSQSEVKEAEWRSQMDKMVSELNSCRQEIEKKDICLKEITKEISSSSSTVEMLQEKLKTLEQIHEKCSSQSEVKEAEMEKMVSDLNSCRKEIEKKDSCLKEITKELNDYNSLMLELTIEKEESAIMMEALKSTLLEFRSKINEELGSKNLESMKQQHEEEMKKVCDLLDMANEELSDRCCDLNEVEFELQIWKSIAENLQVNLEVNHRTRREVEASLLSQVAIEVNLKQENDEKDQRIIDLEQKLEESKKNTDTLLKFSNLQKVMGCLEEEFEHSTESFFSQLSKMQNEINHFHEAWEKIRTTVVMKEVEVGLRDLVIVELGKDLEKMMMEKEKLMEIIGGVSERINKLSREDGQMMGTLRSIVRSFDDEKDGFDPVKENTNLFQSPKRRNMVVESSGLDRRSPLRALNS